MSQNPHTAFPLVRTLGAVAVLLGLVACAAPRPDASATANLQSTRGNTASGTVRFVQNRRQGAGHRRGQGPEARRRARLSTCMKRATAPVATA
jgi:hypothetical protein